MVNDVDFISNSDARDMVDEAGKSMTTFYRFVREGKIGVRGTGRKRVYKKNDVTSFIHGNLPIDVRKGEQHHLGEDSAKVISRRGLVVEEMNQTNLLYSFVLQYEQVGYKEAIPMETMWAWQQVFPIFWCLYDASNMKDVIALLGLLPLSEEQILRLLKKELSLQNIQTNDILQSSGSYFIISAVKPEATDALSLLLDHVLSYWCEKGISALSVYAEVEKNVEATPLAYTVRENFFAPRPDIGQNVWFLDFSNYNPSVSIQRYQKCVNEGKTSMITLPMQVAKNRVQKDRVRNFSGFRPFSPDGFITKNAQFRRAISDDDIRAILRINASLFGVSKRSEEELLQIRRAWLLRNPEIYHVLVVDGEIVGFLSMFPLPIRVIDRLVRGEIGVSQISEEDILPYEPNRPVDIFVQTLGVDPAIERQSESLFKRYGSFLIKGLMDLFYRWGSRGIEISTVYARSDTPYGKYTARGLGFKLIPSPPGVEKDIYRLDVFHSDQAFLMEYMNVLKDYWKTRALESYKS